ncbi:MAG: T9SS type A sorting domain-containing protein [Ignavibacteriae bacterium]|nr:T9SS type A sorting domain-containing protein [Ignavibacteriota bacterium]
MLALNALTKGMGVFVMRDKITNFCVNKKLKFYLFNVLIISLLSINIKAANIYKMSIQDITIESDSSIGASVYIENVGEAFELTSYQCALSINQSIDLTSLKLSYVEGSSELLNSPDLYVGVENIDGTTELTFVSFIGNDIITKKTLVGKFELEGKIDLSKINLLGIKWDFEGTVSTIITGKNFENITNPESHVSIFTVIEGNEEEEEENKSVKINITGTEASAVTGEQYTDTMLYDGITSMSNGGNYSSSSEGRWAVAGFPQWVTIDLGEETEVEKIMIDGYGSDQGITYDCEFYSGKYGERNFIKEETTDSGSNWSEHSLGGVKSRYITVIITGSKGNSWCDIWEMEVYGISSTSEVKEEETTDEETIPSEYGISQNYPNPFNPSTKVEIKMKEVGNARLDVYNILGEKVLEVLDQELNAGIHEISIDGSKLASGTYIYKLDIGNQFSQIKKMNLIK